MIYSFCTIPAAVLFFYGFAQCSFLWPSATLPGAKPLSSLGQAF